MVLLGSDAAGPARTSFEKLTDARAFEIIEGLRGCHPDLGADTCDLQSNYRRGVMWLLWALWVRFGNDAHSRFFPELTGTWAAEVLAAMEEHYARVQENRRRHLARQGLKKKDWPE